MATTVAGNLHTPILFVIFNRPETTLRVFEEIIKVRPSKLYIAADGPRKNRPGEGRLCELSRENVLKNVTWECEIKTLFREENLGCKLAVSSAISWFFENEEWGIILEDDCLPNSDFFIYCKALLEKYKDVESVMHIGGADFLSGNVRVKETYYFSKMPHIWGWATWRRAWKLYDLHMSKLEEVFENFDEITRDKDIKDYWKKTLNDVKNGKIDTWDYQWVYTIWLNKGLSINSVVNMISNIGFGPDATHTRSVDETVANRKTTVLSNIIHPAVIQRNVLADEYEMSSQKLELGMKDKLGRILNKANRFFSKKV